MKVMAVDREVIPLPSAYSGAGGAVFVSTALALSTHALAGGWEAIGVQR